MILTSTVYPDYHEVDEHLCLDDYGPGRSFSLEVFDSDFDWGYHVVAVAEVGSYFGLGFFSSHIHLHLLGGAVYETKIENENENASGVQETTFSFVVEDSCSIVHLSYPCLFHSCLYPSHYDRGQGNS